MLRWPKLPLVAKRFLPLATRLQTNVVLLGGEHYIEQAQEFRACSIGKAAKSANKLLTGHSEAIKTKGDVLDVSC